MTTDNLKDLIDEVLVWHRKIMTHINYETQVTLDFKQALQKHEGYLDDLRRNMMAGHSVGEDLEANLREYLQTLKARYTEIDSVAVLEAVRHIQGLGQEVIRKVALVEAHPNWDVAKAAQPGIAESLEEMAESANKALFSLDEQIDKSWRVEDMENFRQHCLRSLDLLETMLDRMDGRPPRKEKLRKPN